MSSNDYILYQAYGSEDILNECIYSILSFWRTAHPVSKTNLQIIIYTDNVEFFTWLNPSKNNIHFREIDSSTINSWKGEINFVHRVKIKILQDFYETHDKNTNVLYLDTDTYFLKDIFSVFDQIKMGEIYMHTFERVLATKKNPIFRKIHNFIKNKSFEIAGTTLNIPVDTPMWNAGVLGLNYNQKNILEKVLATTDVLYAQYPKHVMEQLAFSFFLSQQKPLVAAESYIFHYWNFKEFRSILRSFFSAYQKAPLKELIEASKNIIPAELMQNKMAYEQLPFLKKTWKKIIGKRWNMPKIDF